jgi:hypothetical protein
MYANLRKILAEARLEKGAGWSIEGFAGRLQHFIHNGGRFSTRKITGIILLSLERRRPFFFLARSTFALQHCVAGRFRRGVHTHYLIRDTICLKLKRVIDLSNSELWRYCARERHHSEIG